MKLRKGQIVAVTFDDHVQGDDQLMQFTAYGRVASVSRTSLTIDCWHYADPKETDRGDNVDRYTIARRTISRIATLQEVDVKGDKAR